MKTEICLEFANSHHDGNRADFYKALCQKSKLFSDVFREGETIRVGLKDEQRLDQLRWVGLLLQVWDGWEFVGPYCPKSDVPHGPYQRTVSVMRRTDVFWKCTAPDCDHEAPLIESNFMTYREFSDEMLYSASKDAATRNGYVQTLAGRQAMAGISGRLDSREPNRPGQIPRTEISPLLRKKTLLKDTLGVDYASFEVALLIDQLGLKDIPKVSDLDSFGDIDAAALYLHMGGAILFQPQRPSDVPDICSAIKNWEQKQKGAMPALLVMEVDEPHLDLEKINNPEGSLRMTTKAMIDKKSLRQAAKIMNFSEYYPASRQVPLSESCIKDVITDMETLSAIAVHTPAAAERLIKDCLEKFPSLSVEKFHRHVSVYAMRQIRELESALDQQKIVTQNAVESLRNRLTKSEREAVLEKICQDRQMTIQNYEKWHQEHAANGTEVSEGLSKAADAMLRFLAGVNFQDHSRDEQREFLVLFARLKNVLIEYGVGHAG